ncbi:MAG TPA: hypothetical protein VGV89_06875 [Thermoplasmata archaeon]|nr:hypothetical protein [Candidatus Acidoferrales bacterium]HEV2317279.1 hypothetical protein [Thermoplasmata archaeon]
MAGNGLYGPVMGLAHAVSEVSKVPVDQIAGYVVLVVNLGGEVGTVAAGISREEQMAACASVIARLATSPVPDAVVVDET